MKVVIPTPVLREAAEVLASVRDDIVVIGASAARLPVNTTIPELDHHRVAVGFPEAPETLRLWCADAAALVGLKGQAFGRTRPDGRPVERDFSDVALLLHHLSDEIVKQVVGDMVMRGRVTKAATRLADDDEAAAAAARELVSSGAYTTTLTARRMIDRASRRALRSLAD